MCDNLKKFTTYPMKNISTNKVHEYTFLSTGLTFKDENTGKTVTFDRGDIFGDSPLVELQKGGRRKTRKAKKAIKASKVKKTRKH